MGIVAGVTFGIAFSQVQNIENAFLSQKNSSSVIQFRNFLFVRDKLGGRKQV